MMPSAIDTHALVPFVETHQLTSETRERHARGHARLEYWCALVQRMVTSLTPVRRERHALSFEASLDRFVQEYPALSLYAFARI
jgi:hypothetical protein